MSSPMHSGFDFLSSVFIERGLKDNKEEEGCAVFYLKCSVLEMRPAHPLLNLGTQIHKPSLQAPELLESKAPCLRMVAARQAKAKLRAAKLMYVFI